MEPIAAIASTIFRILGLNYFLHFLQRLIRIPASFALLLVNLIPIYGVLALNWNVFDIVLLYWSENIVIGFYTVLKMLHAEGIEGKDIAFYVNNRLAGSIQKAALTSFFIVHYGMFTLIHGVFVFTSIVPKSSFSLAQNYTGAIGFFIALIISHGLSYYLNYIRQKEYLTKAPQFYFVKPYGRIFVTHITILLGLFIVEILGKDAIVLLFIALKIFFDLIWHFGSHENNANTPAVSSASV